MAGRFSVDAIFRAHDRVTGPVTRMQSRVSKFTRTFSRSLGSLNNASMRLAGGIKRVGLAAVVALGIAGAAFADVMTVGADFDRQMGSAAARFSTPIERGTDRFRELEGAVRDVGRQTEFTATQAAAGAKVLAKAGKSAAFVIRGLGDVVDFTTASELEFAEASNIAVKTMDVFKLTTGELEADLLSLNRVMDVLTKASNSAATDVPELFEALIKGAPAATKAGQSLETYAAVLTTLARSGIVASVAGTGTKNIALGLAGIANHSKKTFGLLGIALSDTKGKMRDVADVMEDLNNALQSKGQAEQLQIVHAIFGKLPIASALNLLGKGPAMIRELRKEFEAARWASKFLANSIRDDVRGSLFELVSAVASVKLSIFQLEKGPLKDAIDRMTEWIRKNEELIAQPIGEFLVMIINNREAIVKFGVKALATAGILLLLAGAIGLVAAGAAALAAIATGGVFAIWGAAIVGLIALVAALAVWWDEVGDFVIIAGIAVGAMLGPVGLLIAAAGVVFSKWEPIKALFQDMWFLAKNVFNALPSWLGGDVLADGSRAGPRGQQGFMIQSPEERTARFIEERRSTSNAEVTIRADAGTNAEVTGGSLGSSIALQPSGAF